MNIFTLFLDNSTNDWNTTRTMIITSLQNKNQIFQFRQLGQMTDKYKQWNFDLFKLIWSICCSHSSCCVQQPWSSSCTLCPMIKLYCTHKTNTDWPNIKIKPKVYLKQVLTEVSLPCMCLESFGSPVILSSSFLCPYPNLPSFADKKDKFYQHTTMKEHFHTSVKRKPCLMAQD